MPLTLLFIYLFIYFYVKFKALASAHNTFWFRTISALPEVTFNLLDESVKRWPSYLR
jgi:hypothetical protein